MVQTELEKELISSAPPLPPFLYMIGIQWSGNPNSGFDEERGGRREGGKFSVSKKSSIFDWKKLDQWSKRRGTLEGALGKLRVSSSPSSQM